MTSPVMLTPAEYAAILRCDLATFIERAFRELNPATPYLPNGHIQVMAKTLEQVMRGEIKRLIINLPPRSLKSHSVSVAFVAWLLGHQPHRQVICASYGQELADKLARDTRSLMQSGFYQHLFAARLADRSAVHDFATTAGGGRMATSVGGVLTGRGADHIFVDDPMKADDALSESRRNDVIDWVEHSLISRLNDKENGSITLTAQRLHEADLSGHLIEQGGWEVLRFPAIAEDDEIHPIGGLFDTPPFVRRAGEALHPARESLQTLEAIRAAIGEYNFQAQYQQQPVPREGTIIKRAWLRYYDPHELPPSFSIELASWDTASKTGQSNDYSVCTLWGAHQGKLYLREVIRERLEFPALERRALELAGAHPLATTLIEDRSSGAQLIQNLRYRGLVSVVPSNPRPDQDKLVRLHAQASLFEAGSVLLPRAAPWLGAYETELLSFPGGRHDDQVDSTTQALAYLREALAEDVLPPVDLSLGLLPRSNPWRIGDYN